MTPSKLSLFVRPTVVAAGFLGFFCAYVFVRRGHLSLEKLGLVGSWFFLGAAVVSVVQLVRRKESGWTVSVVGVAGVAVIAGVVLTLLYG